MNYIARLLRSRYIDLVFFVSAGLLSALLLYHTAIDASDFTCVFSKRAFHNYRVSLTLGLFPATALLLVLHVLKNFVTRRYKHLLIDAAVPALVFGLSNFLKLFPCGLYP
jgi:hypothetical protein